MGYHMAVIVMVAIVAVLIAGALCYRVGLRDGHGDLRGPYPSDGVNELFSHDSERNVAVHTLLESLPMPVAVSDCYGRTLFTSRQLDSALWTDGRFTNADILDMLGIVADSGTQRTRRISLDDGQTWHSVTVAPVGDGLYTITGVDITDQVLFERRRRDFVTNVSHELKTPAGAISLLAETLTDCADDADAVRHFSMRISQEAARMSELISKLIELQKTQTIVPDSSLVPIEVAPVVRQAVDDVSVQSERKSMIVSLDTACDVTARISPKDLRSVVKNLVENAVRYSDEGGHIGVTVDRCDDGGARIRVVDNGIGIPAGEQKRIFERFYRVDRGRSRDTGGTGIGLAIVKNVVEEAGGSVTVWSQPGDGSTFTICLPPVETAGSGVTTDDDDGVVVAPHDAPVAERAAVI